MQLTKRDAEDLVGISRFSCTRNFYGISYERFMNKSVCIQLDNLSPLCAYLPTFRKSPLYDNCFLHAPDGQPLCTCDKKKAKWYLDKGIGGTAQKH